MADEIRVLHVDDEPDFIEMAGTYLQQQLGCLSLRTAAKPDAGFQILQENPIECILSDHEMPGTTGIEFLERVREQHPHVPFILYTGKGSEEIASDAITAGVTDYVQKQWGSEHFELLANRVKSAVDHYRARITYEEVFEKVPTGIVIHDAETYEFVDMNERYAEMFGYEKHEFLDAGFEAIHPDDADYTIETAKERVREAVETGPQTIKWPGVRKDGSSFWAEVHLTPVELHGKNRILAAVRDISESRDRSLP